MNKKYSLTTKCMLSLMIMICLVATINAFQFDNTLSYDSETKTATINDCSVWLGTCLVTGDKIADLQLTSQLNEYVMRGKDRKVAEFIMSNYQKDYDKTEAIALSKIDAYDLRKANAKTDKTFTYKYQKLIGTKNIPIYIDDCKELFDVVNQSTYQSCAKKLTGTSKENVYSWIAFKELSELPEGNVKTGIFVDEVRAGDYIEWIPTFFGVQINEWATFSESLQVGMVGSWNFDETTGSTSKEEKAGDWNASIIGTGITLGRPGVNNSAVWFSATGNGIMNISGAVNPVGNMTINFWMNNTVGEAGDPFPLIKLSAWGFRCTDTETRFSNGNGLTVAIAPFDCDNYKNQWYMITGIRNDSGLYIYLNGTLADTSARGVETNNANTIHLGSYDNTPSLQTFGGEIDGLTIWNRSLSGAEISTLYDLTFYRSGGVSDTPVIALNYPTDNTKTVNTSVAFNCSGNSGYPMLNLSLWINDNLNYTILNLTANENLSLRTIVPLIEGYYNWSCKGYNTLHTVGISGYRWLNVTTNHNYVTNSVSYNNFTNETSTQTFEINMTYNSDKYTSASSVFFYNWTAYTPTTTASGTSDLTISKSIDIPLVTNGVNKTFYWQLALTNATGTYYFNSTLYNQTVSPIAFGLCNITTAGLYLNFTFKDEATNSNINATVDSSTWFYYLGTGAVNRTFLFSSSTANSSYAFCSNTTGLPIKAAVSDMHYLYTLYPTRTLTELFSLTSTTVTNKVLYLLSTSTGIYSTYQVVTPGNQVIQGAHLVITRVIGGSTVVVADGYTDSAGTVTFFLNPNYDHTITVSASGYASQTLTIKPSSSTYTITMSGGGNLFVYNSSIAGITYIKYPASGLLGSGVYNFTFEVFSKKANLENCSMIISNVSTALHSVYGCISSTHGYLSQEVNMSKYTPSTIILGKYSVKIDNVWYVLENDARWRYMNRTLNDTSTLNLRNALNETYSLPEWGSDPAKADFSRIVFFFLFFAIILAAINFYSSYDTAYPGSFFWIMIPVVLLLTFFNGVSGPGFFYLSGATNANFFNPCALDTAAGCIGPHPEYSMLVDNFILPIHFIMLLFIYIFITARRYQG